MTARDVSNRKNLNTARSKWIAAKLAFGAMVFAVPLITGATAAHAKEPAVYTGIVKGVAVGGYDPVAYFTEKKPVAGQAGHRHRTRRDDLAVFNRGQPGRFQG